MALLNRQKLTIIPVLFYWPAIFILAHIPLPPIVFENVPASDKTLHYLGYLVLVFLLWFAISPLKKANWRRASVWWVLLVVVWYGVVDEWLQGYTGRNPDVMDFLADLAGTLTGLILLSIFPFWPAYLVLTAAVIFVLTNLMQAGLADQLPVINAAFRLFAYALFSLLWVQYMHHLLPVRAPQPKWLIGTLALPIVFLLSVELFSMVAGNGFRPTDVIISLIAITATVGTISLMALFRQRFFERSV